MGIIGRRRINCTRVQIIIRLTNNIYYNIYYILCFLKRYTPPVHTYTSYIVFFLFCGNSMCITYFDQSFDKQTQTHLDDLANIVHFKIKYTYDTYLLGTLLIQVYTFFFCKKIYGIKHHLLYNAIEVFLPFLLPLFLLFFPPP